jgi:hypothetical protein
MALDRGIPAAMLARLSSGVFYPVSLVAIEWSDGETYRFHTGFGTLVWGGFDWLPVSYMVGDNVAQIGKITLPSESMSIAAADAALSFVSTFEALLETQSQYARGLEVEFYFGVVTEPSGNILEGDAVKVFTGITSGNEVRHGSPEFDMKITSGVPARAAAAIVHSTEDARARGYVNDTGWDRLGVARKWEARGIQWPE